MTESQESKENTAPDKAMSHSEETLSTRTRLLTFITMYLALFVAYGLYSLPGSFLPLYHEERGISQAVTGLILSVVPFCYIFICPVAGRMLDKGSSKRFMLLCSVGIAVSTFIFSALYLIKDNNLYIAVSIILRTVQGLAGGVIDIVVFSVTAKMYPNNIALITAIIETSVNGAVAASPYIGALLYENLSFMWAFIVPAAAVVLISLISLFAVADVNCRRDSGGSHTKSVVKDWLIMFPAFHCAWAQTLIAYVIPIMVIHTEDQFGKGSVFAGLCLLINVVGVIVSSPVLGHYMDKCEPIYFSIVSGITLPVAYLFLGPAPFLQGLVTSTPTQLIVVLMILGFIKPAACNPSRIIMLQIYKARRGSVPQSVNNLLTSLYCGSFSFGSWFGIFISGFVAEYLTFAQSTAIMGYIAVAESIALFVFCYFALRMKKQARNFNQNNDPVVYENRAVELPK